MPEFQVLLPKVMENRKPFQLKRVLIVYNVMQVISNTLLFYEVINNLILFEYN